MTTIQISLDDDTYSRLRAVAAETGVPVETAAEAALRDVLQRAVRGARIDDIAEEMLEKYRPVFHRLAQ